MATEGDTENEIPFPVLQIFKDEKARPKVVRIYDVNVGWLPEPHPRVLTWRMVDELIEGGKTSADLKWRSKRHQVSLLDLRPRKIIAPRPARTESRALPTQR